LNSTRKALIAAAVAVIFALGLIFWQVKARKIGPVELTPEDMADTMYWIASLPPHMNVNRIEMMPVNQSFGGFQVYRES